MRALILAACVCACAISAQAQVVVNGKPVWPKLPNPADQFTSEQLQGIIDKTKQQSQHMEELHRQGGPTVTTGIPR